MDIGSGRERTIIFFVASVIVGAGVAQAVAGNTPPIPGFEEATIQDTALQYSSVDRHVSLCNDWNEEEADWKRVNPCEAANAELFSFVDSNYSFATTREQAQAYFDACDLVSFSGLCKASAAMARIGNIPERFAIKIDEGSLSATDQDQLVRLINKRCQAVPTDRFTGSCYKGVGASINPLDFEQPQTILKALTLCEELGSPWAVQCKKGVAYNLRAPLDVAEVEIVESVNDDVHHHTHNEAHTHADTAGGEEGQEWWQQMKQEYGTQYLTTNSTPVQRLIQTCDQLPSGDRLYCRSAIGYQIGWHNIKLDRMLSDLPEDHPDWAQRRYIDWELVGDMCNALPQQYVASCFDGIGRHVSRMDNRGWRGVNESACEAYTGTNRDRCLRGAFALETFLAGWDPEKLRTQCWNEDAAYREYCYEAAAIKFLGVYDYDKAKAQEACRSLGEGGQRCTTAVDAEMQKFEAGEGGLDITTHFCGM